MNETATPIEFLEWFYINADFGPADGDVRHYLKQQFMKSTGKNLPDGFGDEE